MLSIAETDDAARERILTDLDMTMLVEAGAGSGKTTSLVGRMLALVARGEPVERIAAVTFTRKAANELRERFQLRLEQAMVAAAAGSSEAFRFDRALRELDRAFLGTIHAFCGRLLREHPLEVPLDPNFQEVTEDAWDELTRTFWNRWLERAKRTDDPQLSALSEIGVDARTLFDGFLCVIRYGDVEFPLQETTLPDTASCLRELEVLLTRARALLPREEPADGWDELMRLVRRLDVRRRTGDWAQVVEFCTELEYITKRRCEITQKRWSGTKEGKASAKALSEGFVSLLEGAIATTLRCWREYRYPIVMRFLLRAASDFARERHATGQLGFEDLLMLTARLLRNHARVRDHLGARYTRLLVDEFQDTDPLQAEICFLLTSDSVQGHDWRCVTPRPGGLFLVGDPKQSIYRFRRADIQVYDFAKSRIATCGVVLALTRNFRSVPPIASVVNAYFAATFPSVADAVQAPFSLMQAVCDAGAGQGVFRYTVQPSANNKTAIVTLDAALVASWISSRIERGECAAGDFLILTDAKAPIVHYARALAERNVPVATTGATLPQEYELRELLVVLHALADPENAVLVAAALEGMFFGCSPADLYDARTAGLQFSVTHRPTELDGRAALVSRALGQLHEWWQLSQQSPTDVVLERIVEETGLLAYAASQPLGDARAGALLHLVEAVRAASMSGLSGVSDTMEYLSILLSREADDAPLRPGRTDAVRVMNLHKAKGLEARVVILAAPVDRPMFSPVVHIHRGAGDMPTGGLVIFSGNIALAQPPAWETMEAEAARFAAAERERLLYVATTRPMGELVVARCVRENKSGLIPDTSAWSPLADVLDRHATDLALSVTPAPGRRVVTTTREEILARLEDARIRVERASVPSITTRSVTESAKMVAGDVPQRTGRGTRWGRAVHRCIEAMGRGRSGESLNTFVAAVAADEGLASDEIPALEQLLTTLRSSAAWIALTAYPSCHFELPVMHYTEDNTGAQLIQGVIDAAVLSGQGWSLIDWKTDHVSVEEWTARQQTYRQQVNAYAHILGALTECPTRGTIERLLT